MDYNIIKKGKNVNFDGNTSDKFRIIIHDDDGETYELSPTYLNLYENFVSKDGEICNAYIISSNSYQNGWKQFAILLDSDNKPIKVERYSYYKEQRFPTIKKEIKI